MSKLISFRAGPLEEHLLIRTDVESFIGATVQRDLDRYYAILALGLDRAHMSEGEAGLLVDTLNGTRIDYMTAQGLVWELLDTEAAVFAKWQVDQSFVDRVGQMSLLTRMAILDAVERFWNLSDADSFSRRLRVCGLVKWD